MNLNDFTLTPALSLKWRGGTIPLLILAALAYCPACIRITVNPQCPDVIEERLTGELVANEHDTGAIPTYLWEADPAGRVEIIDDEQADTSFEAIRPGEVTFTLTARDGFFQMIDTCTTTITAAEPEPDLRVTLSASPTTVEEGGSTLLTCTNTGTTSATLTIDQLDGPPSELTTALPGISVAEFGSVEGTYTFRCVATDAEGNRSDPAVVDVTLETAPRPNPR